MGWTNALIIFACVMAWGCIWHHFQKIEEKVHELEKDLKQHKHSEK